MPPEIQDLLQSIEMLMQYIDANGGNLDQATQQELASFLQEAFQFVEEYQGQAELQGAEQEQAQVAEEVTPPQPSIPPTGGPVPQLDQAPHESSNINAFRYNPKSGQLFVKFQGKYPQQNGPVYSYEGVPAYIYDIFRRGAVAPKTSGKNQWHTWKKGVTPSHGASMYALIKQGNFPYKRIS
jgi:hypothetical protein